jgi:ribosomal protein S12 methylthiotransferase accessory factor
VPRPAAPRTSSPLARPRLRRLAGALGVTRVARVTGLDRAGVEVACAVRPGGHVLQVSNGKGDTFAEAARGAVLEAAELACAEAPPDVAAFASAAELAERGVAFAGEDALGGAASPHRLAWCRAEDLATGAPALVPAAAVHVPPQGGALLGLASVRWTSNGMGAHPAWPAALLHALLEAVERDQLARALPEGFTEDEVRARRIGRAALAGVAPGVAARVARLEARGFDVHLFDLAPARRIGLPVAGALLFDRERGPVPVTAGYACALDQAAALRGALLEAAQSRLTDIHGAREDVAGMEERAVERLRRACERAARGDGHGARGRPPFDSWRRPVRVKRNDASAAMMEIRRLAAPHPGGRNSPPETPHRERHLDRAAPSGRTDSSVRPEPFDSGRSAASAQDRLRAGGAESKGVARVLRLLHRSGHRTVLALDLAPPSLGVHVAKVLVPGLLLSDLLTA